jgi:1,4-dihydroxy-2-naphthoyl-CoA synthase
LWKAADEYGQWFAATSPAAVRLGRRAFTLLADLPAGQALDAAQFLNLAFFLGTDLAEGASAFLEKRSPAWIATGDS